MQSVIFENFAKSLQYVHLVAGVTCLATSVHLFLRILRAVRRPGRYTGQIRLHAGVLCAAYLMSVALGGLSYPAFRVHVRYAFLDETLPWVTGLFEIKELLATIGVIPVIGVLAFSRHLDARSSEHELYFPLFLGLVGFVLFAVIYNACCGWYIGTIRRL